MTILIDVFEPTDLEELIKKEHIKTERKALQAGDYCFGTVGIERKTIDDFKQTLFKHRLWNQMSKLKEVYENPILCITGRYPFPSSVKLLAIVKALMAAKFTVIKSFGIPILEFENDYHFVIGLVQAYFKSSNKRPTFRPIDSKHRSASIEEIRYDIITRLPGVGQKLGTKILDECGNIEILCTKTEVELKAYKGISSNRAKKIKEILSGEGGIKNS